MVYSTGLPNNKDKPFGGVYSVYDDKTCVARDEAITQYVKKQQSIEHEKIKCDFLNTYKEWMFSTHPEITGWQKYNDLCFTQGTIESFTHFFLRYKNSKRLRLAKSEYYYNQMMYGLWFPNNFCWLEDDDIKANDVLLISVPFSDSGNVPDSLEKILSQCDDANVPVMLDLAYINIATNLQIDLNHPCIEYVVSSLSKVFPVELHRIGIRMQRKKFEDQLYVVNEFNHNYFNIMSAYIGLSLIQKFPADFIYKKYKDKQIAMCEKFDLQVSSCVYLGIDTKNKFPEYNRGGKTNRLCFSRIWDGRMNL